jgi:triacylglycerol esterase/lipase EstA (alpha/beta hydrolase family)
LKKQQTGYFGKVDIICHSMGAVVSRWYIEKLDGRNTIRQWIGLAPPNHGSYIANMIKPSSTANDFVDFYMVDQHMIN